MPFDYKTYMANYNRERKKAARLKCQCIDCRAPSPNFVRCLECRVIMQDKARYRYAPKAKRNRVLSPV